MVEDETHIYKIATLYHASETTPEVIREEGLSPGISKCLETANKFIDEICEADLTKEKIKHGLHYLRGILDRCQESVDVFVTEDREMALQNCHASIELQSHIDDFFGRESPGAPGSIKNRELVQNYIKKHPCYLYEIKFSKEDEYDRLATRRGEGMYSELTFSHIPPKHIKKHTRIPLEEDMKSWAKEW